MLIKNLYSQICLLTIIYLPLRKQMTSMTIYLGNKSILKELLVDLIIWFVILSSY